MLVTRLASINLVEKDEGLKAAGSDEHLYSEQ